MGNKFMSILDRLKIKTRKKDKVSTKPNNVNTEELYAKAKKAWDYGSYVSAQRYYVNISEANPTDWRAPLYASMCDFKGFHNISFWVKVPMQMEKIIISTLKFISNLKLKTKLKEKEMTECLEIIKDNNVRLKDQYFKHKTDFETEDKFYVFELEDLYFNLYNQSKSIGLKCMKDYRVFLADLILELIQSENKISRNISKQSLMELEAVAINKYNIDFDSIITEINENTSQDTDNVSQPDVNEIKLKGTMYFKYNDKVLSDKIFKNRLTFGVLVTILSLSGIVVSAIRMDYSFLYFLFPLLYSVVLIIKAFKEKDKINCSSFFSTKRAKSRLTSDGNVVNERSFSFLNIGSYICSGLGILIGLVGCVLTFSPIEEVDTYAIIIGTLCSLNVIFLIISFVKMLCENLDLNEGLYVYSYKGNEYNLR